MNQILTFPRDAAAPRRSIRTRRPRARSRACSTAHDLDRDDSARFCSSAHRRGHAERAADGRALRRPAGQGRDRGGADRRGRGAARRGRAFPAPDYLFADSCGTGGDFSGSINVSTAAGLRRRGLRAAGGQARQPLVHVEMRLGRRARGARRQARPQPARIARDSRPDRLLLPARAALPSRASPMPGRCGGR